MGIDSLNFNLQYGNAFKTGKPSAWEGKNAGQKGIESTSNPFLKSPEAAAPYSKDAGLVARLDRFDSGSLNAPEQRSDNVGRNLYALA